MIGDSAGTWNGDVVEKNN